MMMPTKHRDDGGGFVGRQTETGEGGGGDAAIPPPRRFLRPRGETVQSAMKCTNVTGNAPLLIGSPSMWPSCEEEEDTEARSEDDGRQLQLENHLEHKRNTKHR